ncbi:hypothetical protein D3C72_878120 [compost metagenome]
MGHVGDSGRIRGHGRIRHRRRNRLTPTPQQWPDRLDPHQPRAQQGHQPIGRQFQPSRRLVHRGGGRVEHQRQHCHHRNRHQRLNQRGRQRKQRPIARRLPIGHHIGRDHRLAMPGAQRVKHAVGKRQSNQGPCRTAIGLPGAHRTRQLAVEMALPDGHLPEETGQPARPAHARAAFRHAKRMRALRRGHPHAAQQRQQQQHQRRRPPAKAPGSQRYGHRTSMRCVSPLVMAKSSSGNASGSAGIAASCCMVFQSNSLGLR